MDLSTYYEDFQFTYNLAIFALCLTSFIVIFVGVCRLKDKNESTIKKIIECMLLVIIFASVLVRFMLGPNLAKKDIEQKTIYYFEGFFEITEISNGIYDKAVFLIDGKEICLRYFDNDRYDFDQIKVGKYEGKLIYAQYLAEVLNLEIYKTHPH